MDESLRMDKKPSEIEEMEEDAIDKKFKRFKNFEVLQHPPLDHAFVNYKPKRSAALASFHDKIRKEWEILESNLPSSLYIRTYKSRMDLMRACVVGLEGTPYCHGLLFFDMLLPVNYPVKPPEIFYLHAYTRFDLNPNLQIDGRVLIDLSTSNTSSQWLGCMEQKWKLSHVLDVLLFIQYLILNPKPYFPLKSNKEVFKLSCEAMLRTLRKGPPCNFEDFYRGHFHEQAHSVLQIYKEEILSCDGHHKAAKELFFRLVKAFEANGAYCQHHYNKKESEEFLKGGNGQEEDLFLTNFAHRSLGCLADFMN